MRKETKQHGLQRRIEGPLLDAGRPLPDRRGRRHHRRLDAAGDRGACARPATRSCGVVAVLDRLAGGAERIREAAGGAPYEALATIDDVYPERPDRGLVAAGRRMPRAGFEPAAYSLGGSRSIQLSYRGRRGRGSVHHPLPKHVP